MEPELLDEHAARFARRTAPATRVGRLEEVEDADGRTLASFANSVLWRCSVSSLDIASGVSLGVLEDRVGRAAFGVEGAVTLPVIVNRYVSGDQDVREFLMMPMRERLGGLSVYILPIGGCQLVVIADGRHRPPLPSAIQALVVNDRRSIRCLGVPLERTREYRALAEAARAGAGGRAAR